MKDFAFQTHVECYTQQPYSVCDLPIADWRKIFSVIDTRDLLDKEGAAQALAVLQICASKQSPANPTELDVLSGMINVLVPLANAQTAFVCSCNKKTYADEATCISECKVTLGCFTGICYPIH
jgi:hypothetical protein